MAVIKSLTRLLPYHIHICVYVCVCVCHHMVLSIFDGPLMETDILTVLVN